MPQPLTQEGLQHEENPYRMAGPAGIHQHLSAEQKQDIAGAAYQATPGAGTAVSFRLAGLPLGDWLVLASIAFVALQASFLIWKA
jgi:hypothetical protein